MHVVIFLKLETILISINCRDCDNGDNESECYTTACMGEYDKENQKEYKCQNQAKSNFIFRDICIVDKNNVLTGKEVRNKKDRRRGVPVKMVE